MIIKISVQKVLGRLCLIFPEKEKLKQTLNQNMLIPSFKHVRYNFESFSIHIIFNYV